MPADLPGETSQGLVPSTYALGGGPVDGNPHGAFKLVQISIPAEDPSLRPAVCGRPGASAASWRVADEKAGGVEGSLAAFLAGGRAL